MQKNKYNFKQSEFCNSFNTIRSLFPYLWPKDQNAIRIQVCLSMVLLALAKITTVTVPIILKFAVDAISEPSSSRGIVEKDAIIIVPIGLLVAYGLLRVLSLAFKELQGAVFARVAERAIRKAGVRTFRHLHNLALRFHMDRRTGGLSRAIERGTKGIEYLLRMLLFNIIPI